MSEVRLVCDDKEQVARLLVNVSPPGWNRLENEIILRSPEDEVSHKQYVEALSEDEQIALTWFWHDLGFVP